MLQFIYEKLEKKKKNNIDKNIFNPHFSSTLFKISCQLLDLVTLDITSLRFSYCALAAAAIYILVDPDLAISISGEYCTSKMDFEMFDMAYQWLGKSRWFH